QQAVFEANCGDFHEELVKILGRLKYRTSYGQNVLKHTLEVVHLAGIMADELQASVKTAKRAAMLHDLGKALTHEVEGSHALISAQYAKRYGESQGVVHAIEAHHYEVQPQTVEAVLLIAADAISASRPGARGESLEHYVKRLESLEQLAAGHPGVEKVYALQAGREIRVLVKPHEIDDDGAVLLSDARDCAVRLLGNGTGHCLDLGCGTGRAIPALLAAGWSVVGTDVSADQLRAAREYAGDRVQFVRADAHALPFEAGEFDAVVS